MRDEAMELAARMLESPDDLIQRCRRLLGLLSSLGLRESGVALVFRGIDSEADRWPVGVDPRLLEANYHLRCQAEMRQYGLECWPAVKDGCQAVLALLSSMPDER